MAGYKKRGAKDSEPTFRKCLLRLIPFFMTTAMYMSHFESIDQSIQKTLKLAVDTPPTLLTAFLKCCPIFCLIVFVIVQEDSPQKGKLRYKALIAKGLALGSIGDACLIFPETFLIGMIAFALGHSFYIYAYGFKPLKAGVGFAMFTASTIMLLMVRGGVDDPLIKNAMPFYSVFLVTMAWRALVRMNNSPWRKLGAIGGFLFILSDFLLIIQFQADIPYGELLVMMTYYGSQMCTALTTLDTSLIN